MVKQTWLDLPGKINLTLIPVFAWWSKPDRKAFLKTEAKSEIDLQIGVSTFLNKLLASSLLHRLPMFDPWIDDFRKMYDFIS